MAKKPLIPLHFTGSFSYMSNKSIEKEAFLRRDQADLASRGITVASIDALAADRVAFLAIPTNSSEVHTATVGFDDRNAKADEIVVAIREVIGIAKTTFGVKSPIYKGFDIKSLSTLTPNELYNHSGNVVLRGTQNMTAMALKGLTAGMLTNITTLSGELLVLIAATPILESGAKIITGNRRTAANVLYDNMKAKCEIAKNYYFDRDKTKYNDYVVYDIAPKAIDRSGNVAALGYKSPRTAGITGAKVFRLRVTSGDSLEFFFSMRKGGTAPVGVLTITPNPNIFVTKTAAQLGYDALAGIIFLNVRNPNGTICSFFLKMG